MKNMNNRGFVLAEAFVVSTFVLATLVFMYIQFQNINRAYNTSFSYNTVQDLYITNELKTLINQDDYSSLINELNLNPLGYLVLTDQNFYLTNFSNSSLWAKLLNNGNIKTVIFTYENLEQLKGEVIGENISAKLKDFIKTIRVYNDNDYRIVVEFNNETFASLKIAGDNAKSQIAIGTTYKFDYKINDYTEWIVPANGVYKLEVWGAQGGTPVSYTHVGGKGGYASGEVHLEKNTILNVYIGGTTNNSAAGYNGGGNGSSSYAGGGGATDIRINSISLYSRVIVAGGGGGGLYHSSFGKTGGYGGGSSGQNISSGSYYCNGGSQTSGGLSTENGGAGASSNKGSFGQGGSSSSAPGGGGGWYGGGVLFYSSNVYAACGGSGWIYTANAYATWASAVGTSITNNWLLNSNYYLSNTSLIDGSNSIPNPRGSGSIIGNSGDGYAKITYLGP